MMKWHVQPNGKRGCSQQFSDEAIQFCLSITCLFNLPLRQAIGMTQSLLHLAGVEWPVPDYSTVSRRQKTLQVVIGAVPTMTGLHLTLKIQAMEVTDNSVGDAPVLPALLDQIPADERIASVSGDGAYETRDCHEAIAMRDSIPLFRPARMPNPARYRLTGYRLPLISREPCRPARDSFQPFET
jgi:hypothetical protein